MFGLHDLGLFVGAVLLLNLTPGPDTAYIVARSVAQGRAAGVWSALGIATGCCVHALLAAFGLTALVAASPLAFSIVQYLGAAYLIWLGLRLLFKRVEVAAAPREAAPRGPRSSRQLFGQGLLTNLLNPKVVIFFLSFFPQFVHADSDARASAFLVLGAIFVAMSTVYTCSLAWIAGTVTQRLRSNAGVQRWLERGTGAAFVAIGCKLALARPA
jgi:RhtB (resistance to homoserine/threonine) family protein